MRQKSLPCRSRLSSNIELECLYSPAWLIAVSEFSDEVKQNSIKFHADVGQTLSLNCVCNVRNEK